jgi:hypothetical protein
MAFPRSFPLRAVLCALAFSPLSHAPAAPVLFITATPSSANYGQNKDFSHFVSLVSNHRADARRAPRGGDLYIRYDDGTLRNLTAEAGYGTTPGQEICVREANVHWSGQKAVFSMVVGGTGTNPPVVFFQLYEATGILQGQTVSITKVPGQPTNKNNLQPVYTTDGSIIFVTDLPATKKVSHYPPRDEYESSFVNSGLWKLTADGSELVVIDHCPSGDFTPIIDSFGRVIFTRWDHLKRDQQHDLWIDQQFDWNETTQSFDATPVGSRSRGRAFTYASEDDDAVWWPAQYGDEFFPENGRLHPGKNVPGANPLAIPHAYWDQDYVPGMEQQDFNFFTPWMINEDGSDGEVLNHLGRHELFTFVPKALTSLPDFSRSGKQVLSFHQIREHPTVPGRYYGVSAAEFGKHGAGRIIALDSPPSLNPDLIPATYVDVTPVSAANWATGSPNDLYRDPMIRQDGTIWAACSATFNEVTSTLPDPAPGTSTPYPLSSSYQFKIRQLVPNGKGFLEAGPALCPDIIKTVSYTTNAFFSPSRQSTYTGPMWELYPVEVVPRTPPAPKQEHLAGAGGGRAPRQARRRNRASTRTAAVAGATTTSPSSSPATPPSAPTSSSPTTSRSPGARTRTPRSARRPPRSATSSTSIGALRARLQQRRAGTPSAPNPTNDPGRRALAARARERPQPAASARRARRRREDRRRRLRRRLPPRGARHDLAAHRSPTAPPVVRERYWVTFKRRRDPLLPRLPRPQHRRRPRQPAAHEPVAGPRGPAGLVAGAVRLNEGLGGLREHPGAVGETGG